MQVLTKAQRIKKKSEQLPGFLGSCFFYIIGICEEVCSAHESGGADFRFPEKKIYGKIESIVMIGINQTR